MNTFKHKVSCRFVKTIDGYKTFKYLCKVTHNIYGIRYINFKNRIIYNCGSIKRIFDFAIHFDISYIEVFYYSRRGNLYSHFIDYRGY